MTRTTYKQKFQEGVAYEQESDGHSTPVQTVPFDYPGEQEPAGETAGTRDEMDARLKACGLSQEQRAVYLARWFDRKSTREIAADIGKSKTWVANTLKRNRRRLESVQAKAAVVVTNASKPPGQGQLPPVPLKLALEHIRRVLENYQSLEQGDVGHMASGLSELPADAPEDEKAIAAIALWPRLLTDPKAGPGLAGHLSDLLTAARYGGRVRAKSARKKLAALTRYRQGNRCPIPDAILGSESLALVVTVADLQHAWCARRDEHPGESREARVDFIREKFHGAVDGFSNQKLLPVLQGDLLTAAGRLAEQATGIDARSFVRAWKQIPEIRLLK